MQQTATGIKHFQEDRGFGKWFNALYEVMKTRDSCEPDKYLKRSSSSPNASERSFEDPGENEGEKGALCTCPDNQKIKPFCEGQVKYKRVEQSCERGWNCEGKNTKDLAKKFTNTMEKKLKEALYKGFALTILQCLPK